MIKKELYLLKIGGSLIAGQRNPNEIKYSEIRRILKEIDNARRERGFNIIISHGSGAVGHAPSKHYDVPNGFRSEKARIGSVITERACNRLNGIVTEIANDIGMPVFSFSPHSFSITNNGKISSVYAAPLKAALRYNWVPVTYGDVMMDLKQGFSDISTEEVLRALANSFSPEKIIVCTDVDGLFEGNPKLDAGARLIRKVDRKNIKMALGCAGPSLKVDITGGMKTKISLLYNAVKGTGTRGYILNGGRRGDVYKFLVGQEVDYTEVVGR
ncbi:MAG: hypothetical protein LVQ95_04725 [Candidatus Micrarchaeales archaeon]|nr:hypothetical protein [Candidatus Micrarchaeales archaeon]